MVCFSAVFFLYALFYKRLLKIDEIDNYAKITLFIISYFGARLLLDYSSVPGGEWVENPFLGNLLAPAFSIVGSHVLDSWIYFLILLIFCSIKKKTIPKVFLLAIYSILFVTIVIGFLPKNNSASQQQKKYPTKAPAQKPCVRK